MGESLEFASAHAPYRTAGRRRRDGFGCAGFVL